MSSTSVTATAPAAAREERPAQDGPPDPARRPVPLNAFGAAFGLTGLAGTWTTAAGTLGAPAWIGEAVWALAALVGSATLATYVARAGRWRDVGADLRHPVLGPFAALVPVTLGLHGAHLAVRTPTLGRALVLVAAVGAVAFGAWFVGRMLTEPREPAVVHGGYLLPTVAASFLVGQSLAAVGHPLAGTAFVAAGVLFWLLVGAVVVARLLTGPALAAPLLPTLAIVSAPPAVAGNAWWVVAGAPGAGGLAGAPMHLALVGTMLALLLPHLTLLRRYARLPFATGFWAFTFTAASSATYAVHVLGVVGGPTATAGSWTAVVAATALIAGIGARSLVALTGALRRRAALSQRDGVLDGGVRARLALVGVVAASVGVAFGAGAGSPLLVLDQESWGFPAWQLTAAFSIYAVTLLGTLLIAGRLSDHVGRRPVLVGSLLLLLAAGALFVTADHIAWIVLARAVQGVATGAATSTFTALIIELAPARARQALTVTTSAAPVAGLGLGAFLTGAAVEHASRPTVLVFGLLSVLLVLGIAATLAARETVARRPGAWASLRPRVAVPRPARHALAVLAPLVAAGWMYSGLFLGLVPSIDRDVLGITGPTASAGLVALQPVAAALAGVVAMRVTATRGARAGALLLVAGAVLAASAVHEASVPLLAVAAIIGGAGQGAAFGSVVRILAPLVGTEYRGGLMAAVYLIAYTGYGAPVLIAGAVTGRAGLATTAIAYTSVVAALAGWAVLARVLDGRRPLVHVPASCD